MNSSLPTSIFRKITTPLSRGDRGSNPHNSVKITAFTLIELLAVMAVLSILLALMIPAISRLRGIADNAKCTSNLKQISAACLQYANDNDGFLPPAGPQTAGPQGQVSESLWWERIATYLGAPPDISAYEAERRLNVLICPAAIRKNSPGTDTNNTRIRTYTMNSWVAGANRYIVDQRVIFGSMKLLNAKRPASTVYFVDGDCTGPQPYYDRLLRVQHWVFPSHLERNFVHPGQSANLAFLDGHVENRKVLDIPTNENDTFWDPLK